MERLKGLFVCLIIGFFFHKFLIPFIIGFFKRVRRALFVSSLLDSSYDTVFTLFNKTYREKRWIGHSVVSKASCSVEEMYGKYSICFLF